MSGDNQAASFDLQAYQYHLPTGLIAQHPLEKRDESRLLVMQRRSGKRAHLQFDSICDFFQRGDVLVVNDTRVVPARLYGNKETGGFIELLVLDPHKAPEEGRREGYTCLLKCAKRPRRDSLIFLPKGLRARIQSDPKDGTAIVRFLTSQPLPQILEEIGSVPLPPYIDRNRDEVNAADRHCYQTVYALKPGAVAAPTAGLHFTAELLDKLQNQGVEIVTVTLHVGYGTFAPLRVADIREHRMHSEYAEIPADSAERIRSARAQRRRVIAVGTTVVRTLEWVASEFGEVVSYADWCRHYIYPGYSFRVIDAMVTNFHLPGSSLLLLVSAFAGRSQILSAYQEAIGLGYRFFSYGDAMLIL
ncbi:tRNA preQ1(34) S-adenosylmethionine ribosyltransferase-isomerase QueA [Desulfoferrobacter suflitae]|uniref:tRNA preQ1(34) S-adenosylmethionine ribosyltransferase-isomerase QueA n=1 Tax=Desulfoferrobacter suflitae TaxID=2865782 RepID=UPI00216409DD|nr:tRNA preQ1(34) S-adenosylmethionine ribosyltransferase-isomerase QueA [Desulfoferrobacter suflitae]MCK8602141.1 tRNA preQ1(34) S-adenosylmethionine ribosyltransferase-isomerase QueA [Desulfoferrobacter suflitae]